VATVSEVLRSIPQGFVVLAGSAGLGREVSRILHVRPSTESIASTGSGDLVVYAAADPRRDDGEGVDQALAAVLSSGVAGVLTDVEPTSVNVHAADKHGSPLLTSIGRVETEHLHTMLVRALDLSQSLLGQQQVELQRELSYLSRAGATPPMLLERLVETTGRAGLLQDRDARFEHLQQPVLQDMDQATVRRAIGSSKAATRRWLLETADAAVNNLLYLELPGDHLVRLVAPVWTDGEVRAAVSLFARSDELAARDRIALLAAARAIATAYVEVPPAVIAAVGRGRCAAVVVRATEATLDEVAAATVRRLKQADAALTIGRDDVRVCLAYESADPWEWRRRVAQWQAQLSEDLGTVSLGHAVRWGVDANDARNALVQAAEAALLGDHLFGPGHVSSYADAHLARFLLGNRDVHELRALHEHTVGKLARQDQKRERELVATLAVYCETLSMQRTAERLQVHRNTVLYRIKRIEEITSLDLEDGPTRLFLQLGLLAGRLAPFAKSPPRAPAGNPHNSPHLVRVSPPSSPAHTRTA
jgi:purine catabolism regulator